MLVSFKFRSEYIIKHAYFYISRFFLNSFIFIFSYSFLIFNILYIVHIASFTFVQINVPTFYVLEEEG